MEQLKLGQIVSVVGLKGELKVYPYTDYKERFEELTELTIDKTNYKIEKVRYSNNNIVILKVQGIDDRNTAEKLRGSLILIDKEKARKLPEDTYYIGDLIGLTVVDDDGALVGKLIEVIQNKSQDLYEIETAAGKKFLVPAVEEFILGIDLENNTMKIHLIEGLI